MSTKSTITHGKDFHLYTDYEDGLRIRAICEIRGGLNC